MLERVQKILLQPKKEWAVIEAEPATPAALYTGYVIPLAAIGPLASAIGMTVFGVGFGGVHFDYGASGARSAVPD